MPYATSLTAGTVLKHKISSVFTAVPGVRSIGGSGSSKTKVDVTALSDTAKKYLGGFPDYGELNVELMWDPGDSVHQAILTAAQTSGTTSDIQITMTDAGAATVEYTGGYWDAPQFSWENETYNKLTLKYVPAGAPSVTP